MQFTIGMLSIMAATIVAAAPTQDTNAWGSLRDIKGWNRPDAPASQPWAPQPGAQNPRPWAPQPGGGANSWDGRDGWFPTCDSSCNPDFNPNCIRCNSPIPPAPGCNPDCNPLYNDNCVRCYPDDFHPPNFQCDRSCNPNFNSNCIRCDSPVQPLPGCDPNCNPLYNDNCPRCYPDWVH